MVLNQIVFREFDPEAFLTLDADLYNIETANLLESTVQAAAVAERNEFAVQKVSPGGIVATLIEAGDLELAVPSATKQERTRLVFITLKAKLG